MKAMLLALVLLAACNHSDPIGNDPTGSDLPFDDTPPIRLTYNSDNDLRPHFSQDGRHLLYTFERGTSDRDRCLGVLPASGGQRVAEICADEVGQASRSDGFELGALSTSGLLAFTRHSGTSGGPTATTAGLYIAPIDSLAGARKVFDLLGIPAGGNAKYDYLLDPVWTGPNDVVALAARADIAKACLGCPWDTTFVGIEVVRFDVSGATAQRHVLAAAPNATDLAYDASLSRFYFLVPSGAADTVYTVPLTGGPPSVALIEPNVPNATDGYLTGIAAGGGRLVVSRWYTTPEAPSGRLELSEIVRVGFGGELTVLASRQSRFNFMDGYLSNQGVWGRVALSPDGMHLVAEGIETTGEDLYLLEVAP